MRNITLFSAFSTECGNSLLTFSNILSYSLQILFKNVSTDQVFKLS